jgi:hypothetical protein
LDVTSSTGDNNLDTQPLVRRQARNTRKAKVDYSPEEVADAEKRAEQFLAKIEKRQGKAR